MRKRERERTTLTRQQSTETKEKETYKQEVDALNAKIAILSNLQQVSFKYYL